MAKIKPKWERGQQSPDSLNKVFCTAPWTHTYISPQSERRMCCASREEHMMQRQYIDASNDKSTGKYKEVGTIEDYQPISLKEHWNSPYMMDIRKKLMSGEEISSAWEAEKRKHDLWTPEQQPFMVPENKEVIETFQKEVVEEEFWEYIKSGTVEEIYWVGGEPLMYDIHWKSMDRLAQDGNLNKVHLRYNSNLSRVRFGKHYLYDWLPQAKDWTMCASIDGTGEIGEYIRTGLNWEQWDKNFREGVALPGGNDKMLMDLTLTGPGMFDLKNFFDYALELDVKIETKRMFAFHPDIVMSAMAWPRHILNRIIDENLAYIKPRATQKQQTLINELENMKVTPNFEEQFPDQHEDSFFNGRGWQDKIAEIRPKEKLRIQDIYARDPELFDWWMRTDRKHNYR